MSASSSSDPHRRVSPPAGPPPPPNTQAAAVQAAWKDTLVLGEQWAVLDSKWWKSFTQFIGFDDMKGAIGTPTSTNPPGPIDNSRLQMADSAYELRRDVAEHQDYNIAPKAVWDLLVSWYGGGPDFIREVIEMGGLKKKTRLEMFPQIVVLKWAGADGSPQEPGEVLFLSRKDSFKVLLDKLQAQERVARAALGPPPRVSPLAVAVADADGPAAIASGVAALAVSAGGAEAGAGASAANGDREAALEPLISSPADDSDDEQQQAELIRFWLEDKEEKGKWDMLQGDGLTIPLDNYQLPSATVVLAEKRKLDGTWPRSVAVKDWRDFAVGDIIDARDTVNKWYESTVRDVKAAEKKVFIHFNGWAATWDEWISFDSDRLAPKNTHTSGPRATTTLRWGHMGNEEGPTDAKGAVGLSNLGNTCFMNSTLQCLSNTPFLTEYFLDDDYLPQINRDNPLGWQGRVADEYGALLKELWSGRYRTVSPSKFKQVLGEFQPRFSGYQQQDSSELLSFLLDGLHEDLNQIRQKPATKAVESNGRPDAVVAQEAWDTYRLRNKSVIVDYFQGQLKSKLTCPNCSRVSITFDPFMFLSVPLPAQKEKVQLVAFISSPLVSVAAPQSKPADHATPMIYAVTVPIEGTMKDLKKSLSALTGAPACDIATVDVFHSRCYRVLNDHFPIGDVQANDTVFAFHVHGMTIEETKEEAPPGAAEPVAGAGAGAANGSTEANASAAAASSGAGAEEDTEGAPTTSLKMRQLYPAGVDGEDGMELDDTYGPRKPPATTATSSSAPTVVQVIHQKLEPNVYFAQYPSAKQFNVDACGTPMLVAIPPKATVREARALIEATLAPYLKKPVPPIVAQPVEPQPPKDGETATAPATPQRPYIIVALDTAARSCSKCPLSASCDGCELVGDDLIVLNEYSSRGYYGDRGVAFAIRWLAPVEEYLEARSYDRFPEHPSVIAYREQQKDAAKQLVRLEDCVRLFTLEETLSKEDPWYCSQCKDFVQANKKFDLWKLPSVLIVHLKRFSFTKLWRDKLDTFVDFPLEGLDLSPFCSNPEEHNALYDLYAISNHYGGMGGGHYTAYCKNLENGKWYHHDDSRVSPISERELKSSSAYVLFYRRRGVDLAKP